MYDSIKLCEKISKVGSVFNKGTLDPVVLASDANNNAFFLGYY